MIILTVPKKFLGAVVCIAAVWTTSLPGGVFASSVHNNLQTRLKEMKTTLGLSEGFQDHSAPDPNYKTALNFMGAWMIGDQLGECTIEKGVEVTNKRHVKHIQALLPFLKVNSAQYDPNHQAVVLENALHIYEILTKLSSSDTSASMKNEIVPKLNDEIFDAARTNEVLIPVVWAGARPGGTLISISGTHIKIYDTIYDYRKNGSSPGEKYPSVKIPYRSLLISNFNELKRFKKVILALLVMMSDEKLKAFDEKNDPKDKLIYTFGASFGIVDDQGYKYFNFIFLKMFNDDLNYVELDYTVKFPLFRTEIGPVADIIAYLSSSFRDSETDKFIKWKLGLSHEIIKQFLLRFGSDTDIHLDARDQNSVVDIVKRCANRLLRDTVEMAVSAKLIPKQVGGTDDDLWKLLQTFDMSDKDADSIEFNKLTQQSRKFDLAIKELQKMYTKSISPKSNSNRVETFNPAVNVPELIFSRLKELSTMELKSIVEAIDGITFDYNSLFTADQLNGINAFITVIKNDKRQDLIDTLQNLKKDLETKSSSDKASFIKVINDIIEVLKKKLFYEKDSDYIRDELTTLMHAMTLSKDHGQFNEYCYGTGPLGLNQIQELLTRVMVEDGIPQPKMIVKNGFIKYLEDKFNGFNSENLFNLIKTLKEQLRTKKTGVNARLEEIRKGRKDTEIQSTKSHANAKEITMITKIVELRKDLMKWVNGKDNDVYKLSKISRSLGQREMSLRQITYFGIQAVIDIPLDLTKYLSSGKASPDLTDCMSGSKRVITSLDEFIDAFQPFVPSWKWLKFSFTIDNPQCTPFLRRNAELLLRNLQLSGLDRESLKRWTPKNQNQYKIFLKTITNIFGIVSSSPNTERTLEDYVIMLRLQRITWRVAQAMDLLFAEVEPKRHLDLLQYSLTYPQCHNLVKGKMTYSNYFLADSGAYSNVLNTETMTELKNLCKSLIEEENSAKPVLNYEKYMGITPPWQDPLAFERINPGDREIYYKMAQHPVISRVVRENHQTYNLGGQSVSENAARSACLGHVGSQILYYQFFDALKLIFTSNMAISQPVNTVDVIPLAFIPLKFFENTFGSILVAIPRRMRVKTTLTPVNEELIKMNRKSYLKTSITEMVTSHILGLDVLLNHLGRASAKFWSTGSIIEAPKKAQTFFGFDIVDEIKLYLEDFLAFSETLKGGASREANNERFKIKTFRRNVASTADFFLNCSSHLIRKLDLAPGYEDLVISLLVKAFQATDESLLGILKEMESLGEVEFKSISQEEIDNSVREHDKNQQYLNASKTSPDEFLKSLINWSILAVRFNARIRSLKPQWEHYNPSLPSQLYTALSKYSSLNSRNNRLIAPLDRVLSSHVDYALFMICAMNLEDANLRQTVYDNLSSLSPSKEDDGDAVKLPKDDAILNSAMLMHRFLALNSYEADRNGPLTEDFIVHQFAIDKVMSAINSLDQHNESFLIAVANYMSTLLRENPKNILENYSQDDLKKGIMIYGRFSINLIQGTILENGKKARNPNDILHYPLFRQFFSSGAEQLVATLGRDTVDCPIRYEVNDFLKSGTKYSICEYRDKKEITIYRHIEIGSFKRPCLLVVQKRVIDALQQSFSIYPSSGVDLYHCKRGNNANFVWIARNSLKPMYISHGRLWFISPDISKAYFESLSKVEDSKEAAMEMFNLQKAIEFEFNVKAKLTDPEMNLIDRLLAPTIFFPRLEITETSDKSVYPLTADTKMMIIPEPIVRFSGGSRFGSYMHEKNIIFMFQQFRFRDRPEVALTFIEGKDGNLEMKGREDLQICEDQIFENNFWPALMMKKIDETGNEIRFAYLPITNSYSGDSSNSASNQFDKNVAIKSLDEKISVAYDPEQGNKLSLGSSSQMIFMEAMAVERGDFKMINSKGDKLYEYKLKPTSRLQRILLAYYNLRLRNYDESLNLLDPRIDFDHNTEFNDDERTILNWMIKHVAGQDPEALALRLMANIHLILNKELFPGEYKKAKALSGNSQDDQLMKMVFNDNRSIVAAYTNRDEVNFEGRDETELNEKYEPVSYLGAYFNYIHVLPKRFHVDYVFKDAMASLKVKRLMHSEYNNGILIPARKTLVFGDLKFDSKCSDSDCITFDFDGKRILKKSLLEAPSQATENTLEQAIKNRYSNFYFAKNCELARMMCQKIISVYGRRGNENKRFSELGLDELQELAVIYLQFRGNTANEVDRMLNRLIYPGAENSENFTEIRSKIDLNKFEEELEIVRDRDGYEIPSPKPKLKEFTEAVLNGGMRDIYHRPRTQLFDRYDINAGDNDAIMELVMEMLKDLIPSFQKRDVSLVMNDLYTTPQISDDINSIRFTAEDLHYITAEDLQVFTEIVQNINEVFEEHVGDMDEALKLSKLKVESKTQESLQKAVEDYMKDYKYKIPEKFDSFLYSNPFEKLQTLITGRKTELQRNLRTLERNYDNFFRELRHHGTHKTIAVLANLKRMFDLNKKPSLTDLRDCLMQMKFSCLKNRLPEFSKKEIDNILKILKEYYIQKILLNNLISVERKIVDFNKLATNASVAEAELSRLSPTQDAEKIQQLKTDIFGHKDTASLTVDDILVDMQKLMLFEVRLQDPVTLNFEFMSAKFHLTNVQVQDIASLATRNWESQIREEIIPMIERYEDELTAENLDVSDKLKEDNPDQYKANIKKLDDIGKKYLKAAPKNLVAIFSKYLKLKQRFKNRKHIDTKELWTYMPRDERLIDSGSNEILNYNDYYTRRPMLRALELSGSGKLRPYNSAKDSYISRVIQRKMAAGKTTVLGTAATVKKADGKTLSVLVILSSLYQSSAPDMQRRTSEYFKTRGFAFAMPKPRLTVPPIGDNDHPARNFLTWTLKSLVNTINSNGYLVVTPETLQAFLNSYVEYLDAFINTPTGKVNPELSRCLHLFATIYEIFRQRGSIILDEIDSSMRPQKELNFPTTKRENILISGVELTSDLLLHSAIDEDIKMAGLNLLANQQAALNDDQFKDVRKIWREYVKSQLESDEGNIWKNIFLPDDDDNPLYNAEDLVKFLFDPSALDRNDDPTAQDREIEFMVQVRNKSPAIFHAMMVVKMQLKNWLRNCFKGAVNEHYGPAINTSDKKPILYAIPYLAAKTPAEGSIFADRWETVNKTLMMYLVKDLSLDEVSKIIADLINISQKDVQSLNVKEEFAAACPGRELLSVRFNPQNKIVDKDNSIMKCMKGRSVHSLKLIFYWVVKMIFEKEEFFAEQITSNAINLTSMFPSVQGYSGTIDNVNILPHQVMIEAEKDHEENEKANGAITMKLLQQKNCVTTVQNIETITQIDKLLDEMCKGFNDLSIFSAFIDVGALLKDYNNADVAVALAKKFKRKTILYYDELSNKLQYLEYDSANDSRIRATLEGSETKYLDSATNSFVKDRFTYYDQRHITGSDILQPPTAKAFLTIGPKVLLRDILQGVMRMRQFQSGQSIHFITTSSVETLLSKYCDEVLPEGNEPRVNQKHLIALGALNEDEKQLNENVRLYRVKIDAEIRAFVMDKLTTALAEKDPYNERLRAALGYFSPDGIKLTYNHEELFKKTRPLFIRNVQEDPISWATINREVDAAIVVKQFMQKRVSLVPDYWKTRPGWDKVVQNLGILTKPLDKNADSRSVLKYLNSKLETTEIPAKFVRPKGESTELGGELEMQLQLELQQEVKVELEQCVDSIDGLEFLPEPTLSISKQLHTTLNFLFNPTTPTSPYEILSKIPELLTPWKLNESYGNNAEFSRFFETDILCPGLSNRAPGLSVDQYCKENDGFVGITRGLAKVSTSSYLDFVTLMSREATHLLFWRGQDGITKKFKYGIFLLSGSEAISLHQSWIYKSCMSSRSDTFWLTDLYGFEVHGSPYTETEMSSRKFSLLEKEYKEHFARLHFRALLLNGSYNVIIASQEMYHRLRIWIGDDELFRAEPELEQDYGSSGISPETASKRAKLLLARMSWMSKLREELVPQDPFVRLLMRVAANLPAQFDEADKEYGKEHVSHNHAEFNSWRHSGNVLIDQESEEAKPWKTASNINTSKGPNPISITVIVLAIATILAIGIFIWGQYKGIVWSEYLKSIFAKDQEVDIVEIEEEEINEIIEEVTEAEAAGVSN